MPLEFFKTRKMQAQQEKSVISSIRFMGPTRRKPQEGDRRNTKAHGVQIRVRARAFDGFGKPVGLLVNAGKPVYEWRCPGELASWDRWLLTDDESDRYFPEKMGAGYMQQRGAA